MSKLVESTVERPAVSGIFSITGACGASPGGGPAWHQAGWLDRQNTRNRGATIESRRLVI